MAIRVGPAGYMKSMLGLAKSAGEAQAAQRQAEQAQRAQLQREAWDRQEKERLFDVQLREQAFQQAKQWELQKMAIRSQNDFLAEERRHQALKEIQMQQELRSMSKLQAKINAIRESQTLSPDEKERAILQVKTGIPVYSGREKGMDWSQYLMETQGQAGQEPGQETIQVRRKSDGMAGEIPIEEFNPALYEYLESTPPSQTVPSSLGSGPGAGGTWTVQKPDLWEKIRKTFEVAGGRSSSIAGGKTFPAPKY